MKKKTISNNTAGADVDYKKLALVNDDLLKVSRVQLGPVPLTDRLHCRCGRSPRPRTPSSGWSSAGCEVTWRRPDTSWTELRRGSVSSLVMPQQLISFGTPLGGGEGGSPYDMELMG